MANDVSGAQGEKEPEDDLLDGQYNRYLEDSEDSSGSDKGVNQESSEVSPEMLEGFQTSSDMISSEQNEKYSHLKDEICFPYEFIRDIQGEMMSDVLNTIKTKTNLVAHAPTGLGKTVAAIAPALRYARDHKKTVFFLTSRHTQHVIAIDTLRAIKEKLSEQSENHVDTKDKSSLKKSQKTDNNKLVAVDLIGKQWMCGVAGAEALYSSDFVEYCRKQREEGKCEFYLNTKKNGKPTTEASLAIELLEKESPLHIEKFKELCVKDTLCPYELAAMMARDANVVVADYYYIFNPSVMTRFFNRAELKLEDVIVIVDEAHNLPSRIRDLMTKNLSSIIIKRAIKEAEKFRHDEALVVLSGLQRILEELSERLKPGDEILTTKDAFMDSVKAFHDYDEAIATLEEAAEMVREKDRQSFIGSIAGFLEIWREDDKGFIRIIQKKDRIDGKSERREQVFTILSHRCLDPSIVTKDILEKVHATILMSGTLTPTSMYRDLIGMPKEETLEKSYKNPFPKKNRLYMIIPETTTKFTLRNDEQFRRIGEICAQVTNAVPGNSAIFFPSYYLRDQIFKHFSNKSKKTTFIEESDWSKAEKQEFLEKFKTYKNIGAVLMGVMSGNFSEGIDLPGDLLKCVVVVGLPLQKPDLETKKLIDYYDVKFGKGWDYGYLFPAFNKTMQAAGRCIRSEKDKGIVIFLDERFAWENYYRCFPPDSGVKITKLYVDRVNEFFSADKK